MTLFGEIDVAQPAARAVGPFAGVAIEQSVDRVLDYSIPTRLASIIQVGQRVKVPLGRNNKPAFGYVISVKPQSDYPKTKNVTAIDDERVLVDGRMLELAQWMARYYCTPLGTVIENIIPSAVKKRIGIGYSQIVSLAQDRATIQAVLEKTRAPKRRSILARLLQLDANSTIEINRLAGEASVTPPTIRKLVPMGLIAIRSQPDMTGFIADMDVGGGTQSPIDLNQDQRRVFDELLPRVREGGSA